MSAEILRRSFAISDNVFVVGLMDRRVTVYKQQVRALNLIYALLEAKDRSIHSRIAVIGGGFSGVTAAAAAASLGHKVWLFEQRPVLCHLQHGCDTRWIHPHSYDWPRLGSDNPHAGLPLLNWRAGPASDVTEQVLTAFNTICRSTGRIEQHLGASTKVNVANSTVEWDNSLGGQRGGMMSFDVIILAVGFGAERGVWDKDVVSYWRNDSLNQPKPASPTERSETIFVSGTGDGGLIDLLRSRIVGFNQGRILSELFPCFGASPEESELITRLREISNEWNSERSQGWLFAKYDELDALQLTQELKRRVRRRTRDDTTAILNGRANTLVEALRLDQASIFNTFLTHQLYQSGGFTYLPGKCKVTGDQILVDDKVQSPVDHAVLRHGTDRRPVLLKAGLTSDMVEDISSTSTIDAVDTSQPHWPGGWWNSVQSDVAPKQDRYVYAIPQHWGEFVEPASVAVATTFVRTLATILGSLVDARWRVVLHRFISKQNKDMFQQVSTCGGKLAGGPPGRVFDAERGATGFASRLRRPVIIIRSDDFETVLRYLDLNPAIVSQSQIQSWFVCPFFAPLANVESRRVLLALFIEVDRADVWSEQILRCIVNACAGFRESLDDQIETGTISCASSYYGGFSSASLQLKIREDRQFARTRNSIMHSHSAFAGFRGALTFRHATSFSLDFVATPRSYD